MPSANSQWRGYVSRNKRGSSRRPRSGTVSTQSAGLRVGGGTNVVAARVVPNSTSEGRSTSRVARVL